MTKTSRDFAERACGTGAVDHYIMVKRFFTKFGLALQAAYAQAVDGTCGTMRGDADVTTRLGQWEFCTSANGKNSTGEARQQEQAAGHVVQVLGRPVKGRMSGVEFLLAHGVEDPLAMADECNEAAFNIARDEIRQMALW